MKLICLGTGHGKPERNRRYTSLLLEVSGSYYVIDAGTNIEEYMISKELPVDNIKSIFITHTHIDHLGALTPLANYICVRRSGAGVRLYLPEEPVAEAFEKWLDVLHIISRPAHIDWKKESLLIGLAAEGCFYEDENIKVWGMKTDHILGYNTFAYMVEAEGKRILFTGDLSRDLHDYPQVLFEKDFDAVICELTHYYDPAKEDFFDGVMDKFQNSRTKRFIFNHVRPNCELLMRTKYLNVLQQKAEIASDGEVFEL